MTRAPFVLIMGAVALTFSLGVATAQQADTSGPRPASAGPFRPSPPSPVIKPATLPHLAAAEQAAGKEYVAALLQCNVALPQGQKIQVPTAAEIRQQGGRPGFPPEPAQVFDNLYYLGVRLVSAWAVNTRDGIILIDALENQTSAEQAIEGGLRKLGLDPARIKYILVTHGHGDHFGGAKYLAEKYHAKVMMSDVDWGVAAQDSPPDANFGPAPAKDLSVADGQQFTLGGETLTFYLTPGHTPGTVSVLIPVSDHGQHHLVALWGGTGFNFQPSEARFQQYSDSAQRFMKLALAAGADVILSNHPENDNSIKYNDELAKRGPGDANPYVKGPDAVRRFLTAYSECAQVFKSQMAP